MKPEEPKASNKSHYNILIITAYNRSPKKRLYFDMDGVLVDFESGLAQVDADTLKEYEGRSDEMAGLFG